MYRRLWSETWRQKKVHIKFVANPACKATHLCHRERLIKFMSLNPKPDAHTLYTLHLEELEQIFPEMVRDLNLPSALLDWLRVWRLREFEGRAL